MLALDLDCRDSGQNKLSAVGSGQPYWIANTAADVVERDKYLDTGSVLGDAKDAVIAAVKPTLAEYVTVAEVGPHTAS